ncbi:MAG: HAD family hydrolase [Candidatus Bathyarchaeota archaeon]|nr:HAD family hydrolase [Candidatus Bathyarchaeota archaeon]
MSSPMNIKAVILDFGGTLADGGLDWDPYHERIRSILASRGNLVEMSKLKRALREALADLNKVRARGKDMTFEDVYDMFLAKLDLPGDREVLKELHDNFKAHYKTEYFHCIEDVLKSLSAKYKVALLSNTMSDQPRELLEEAGYDKYFELIICSRDLEIRKPNPKIFKYMLDNLGVNPEETVHVGDSVEADMYGARDSGITGVWIKSPNQPLWSGHAISSICELPRFLEVLEDGESS